jgi:hypothetical protein
MVSTSKYRGEFPKEALNFRRGSDPKVIRDSDWKEKDSGREQNSGEAAKPYKGQAGPRGYLLPRVREKAREAARNSKAGAAVERPMPAGSERTLQR